MDRTSNGSYQRWLESERLSPSAQGSLARHRAYRDDVPADLLEAMNRPGCHPDDTHDRLVDAGIIDGPKKRQRGHDDDVDLMEAKEPRRRTQEVEGLCGTVCRPFVYVG